MDGGKITHYSPDNLSLKPTPGIRWVFCQASVAGRGLSFTFRLQDHVEVRMRSLLLVASLLGVLSTAVAGPVEGDLFGYRLSAKYPVGAETRGYFMDFMGSMVVMAEKPEMPPDFERLELITTPKTFTVANIYAVAEFADEEKAIAFTSRYADLLETLHGSKCSPLKAYLEEALKLLCGGSYELTVHRFRPDKPTEKHKVHVALKFDNDSKAGKHIVAQFGSELKQLENEGKKQRLEKALKEQKLKGMQ